MALISKKIDTLEDKSHKVVEEIMEPTDSTYTALVPRERKNRMFKYIDGKNWNVTFYGQIVDQGSPLNHLDIKEGNFAKSYVKINNMLLKVQSDLSYEYDQEQGVSDLSGSAILPDKVRANPGDIFIAVVEDGQKVAFVVSSVERLTHRKDTLYEIEYSALAWLNDDPIYLNKLDSRINEEYFYDNYVDSLNTKVLVTTEEKFNIDKLREHLFNSQTYYFKMFRQRETGSLLVPGFNQSAFDQLLDKFIRRTADVSKFDTVGMYSYSNYGEGYNEKTILDSLITRTLPRSKHTTCRKCGYFYKSEYFRRARILSPQFFGIDLLLHPFDNRDRIVKDKESIGGSDRMSNVPVITEANYYNELTTKVKGREGEKDIFLLPELFVDDYYIVSKAFYDYMDEPLKVDTVSFLEILIHRYLSGETVDLSDIFKVFDTWDDWSLLHKYYILPVMWLITKSSLGMA